jgi:hypothetical protein
MTTDRERILELLRELSEQRPELRIGQIIEAAFMRSDGWESSFYIDDRDLLYALLKLTRYSK